MSSEDLILDVEDGTARLTLNRPDKRNAVTYEMWHEMPSMCAALADDDSVRLLVIAGEGEHFCAGADVSGFGQVSAEDYAAANLAADQAIATFPKPTIAFIVGSCVGGGAQIATACDMRLADRTARFGMTPARLGILYPVPAIERAVHTIGPSATKHLLYSAEIIDAERALRIGLIDELFDPSGARVRLDELASLLTNRRSLLTQMASKEMVDDVVRAGTVAPATAARWDERLETSDDAREGIEAFSEQRDPNFSWTPGSTAEFGSGATDHRHRPSGD